MADLFTLRVFARNLLQENHRRNFCFEISFCCLTCDTNTGFISNKATYYLLNYGDFKLQHTYIHNWPLQASHSTHVVCVNFICEQWDLQFNIDPKRQIFEKFFLLNLSYSLSFCQKFAERKSPKKYFFFFFHISFCCLS